MKRILFQGDSITDCCRCYENDDYPGSGYAAFVKGELDYSFPNEYKFINKGIAGNRIVDLYARVKCDLINLQPDYLSILIGVNDVWHELDYKNGISTPIFEKLYSLLIETVKEALPDLKIFIMEPFILEYEATKSTDDEPDKWNIFYSGVREKAEVSRFIAEKYNLPFIELQSRLEREADALGTSTVTLDGVHPSTTGHKIIAEEWLHCFEANK